ncbi:hypothetical protein B0H14DRAFT_2757553 [Mycena olivaceomarginata]|nr:hypothetical protein B0H14DRAFT_2757553 [Mycena olivaceomarginata]
MFPSHTAYQRHAVQAPYILPPLCLFLSLRCCASAHPSPCNMRSASPRRHAPPCSPHALVPCRAIPRRVSCRATR